MFRPTLLALSIAGIVPATALATTITGKVTDQAGKPVAGAEITLEGSRRVELTDAQGNYRFADIEQSKIHLHASSPRYIHDDKDLGAVSTDTTVNFVLAPASMENIVVTATALQSSVLESVTPVSVIGADELRKREAPTLGETLKSTPGVQSTYFGPVASSPIIRGNDGPRVKIVQNGLDVSDVSRIGPDHNVTSNTSSATQIEVLRGPATLQYGSGAIGGVVNVVDNRIPRTLPGGVDGEAQLRYSSVDNGRFGAVDVTGSQGNVAFHFDGYKRKTDDIDIPGYGEAEPDGDQPKGTLENTSIDTSDFTAGLSYIFDEGYLGFAVERLDNLYGVPGHEHGHEEEEAAADADDNPQKGVKLDVGMTRYQMDGEWHSPFKGITNAKLAAAYTDYSHTEIEDGVPGTQFNNKGSNVKLSLYHAEVQGWHGVFGVQAQNSDYAAIGEEAFSPPTSTDTYSGFLIEQRKIGNVTYELGARLEHTRFSADDTAIDVEFMGADGEIEQDLQFAFDDYTFNSTSVSAGFNWEYTPGYGLAVTLSRSERAPSQQELFTAGQHLATGTYEVGLAFDMDENGVISSELNNVDKEISNNLDVTLRKFNDNWRYTVSLFYNQAQNYIYEGATGLEAVTGDHDHETTEDHADEEGLPVFYLQQADADISGFEAEAFVDMTDQWRVSVFSDYIRAKLKNQDLPRIPPMRVGATVSYQGDTLSGEFGAVWYDDQTKTAPFETATDGYTLVNASLEYEMMAGDLDWVFFVKGDNLTNEEARVHTSFLKDQAPLPGRNFAIGVRAMF